MYYVRAISDGLIDKNTYYKADQYWFTALSGGARALYAQWYPKNGEMVLKDDLLYVCLRVEKADYKTGVLTLDYEFVNHQLEQTKEDDVL